MSLSKAAKKALEVLKAGGKIHQHPKELRLRDSAGTIVLGFGPATLKQLDEAGALTKESATPGGTVYVVHPAFKATTMDEFFDAVVSTANTAQLRACTVAAYAVRHARNDGLAHAQDVLELAVAQARRQDIPDAAIQDALGDLPLPAAS